MPNEIKNVYPEPAAKLKVFTLKIPMDGERDFPTREMAEEMIEKKANEISARFQDLIKMTREESVIVENEKGFMNKLGYTDVEPYEIVKVISGITVEIRRMKAELHPDWKPELHVGGFSAHCSNNHSQAYIYESDPDRPVIRVRRKKNGYWVRNGQEFSLNERPVKFYDYNF